MDAKGSQFSKYLMTRVSDTDSTNYTLRHGDAQVGSMLVSHHKQYIGKPIYPNDPEKRIGKYDLTTRDPEEASWKGHDETWANMAAVSAGARPGDDVQIPLFAQAHQPKHNEVFLMAMAKQHRAMAGTMLGVADADAVAKTGVGLSASSNLSEHSLGMVKGLAARGVVPQGDVPKEAKNDITWEPPHFVGHRQPSPQHIVSREDMQAGRMAFRSKIRTKPVADPNQGRLF